MSDYECYVCEYDTHVEEKPTWCPSCGSMDTFKEMQTDAQTISELQSTITDLVHANDKEVDRLRSLLKECGEVIESTKQFTGHYQKCYGFLGHNKCDCGFDEMFEKIHALMEKLKGEG